MKIQLKHSVIILIIIFIALIIISYFCSNNYWSSFSGNISTEIIGILLTILLIDLILKKQEGTRKRKIEKVAVKNIYESIDNYLEVLLSFKNDTGDDQFYSMFQDFDKEYYDKLSKIDFSKPSQHITKMCYYDFLLLHRNKFTGSIQSIINKYVVFLDENLINLLENTLTTATIFIPSSFFHFAINKTENAKYIFKSDQKNELKNELKKHINSLLKLAEYCNNSNFLNKQIDKIQVTSYSNLNITRN